MLSFKNSKLLTQGQALKAEMIPGIEKGANESEYSRDKENHEPDLYYKRRPLGMSSPIGSLALWDFGDTQDCLAKNPHLKFARGPDDTGVIISYNTEASEVKGKNPVPLPGGISINPITWTREESVATAEENLGSMLLNEDGKWVSVQKYADARVDKTRGVVICSTADVKKLSPGNELFPQGVYHSFDYPFYYYNIRENAANRTKKFLALQSSAQPVSYPISAKVAI